MPNKQDVQNKGPSAAGFHFYNLYQCCPYKFYLRNVRGLDTMWKGPALIRGDAVHQGLELFYKTGILGDAVDLASFVVEESALDMQDDTGELMEKVQKTAAEMVRAWAVGYGEADFSNYEEFALEQEAEIPLLDKDGKETGKRVTVRIDRLGRTADGKWDMFDTKTSTFSKDLTEKAFAMSDQPTLYVAACEKALGIKVRSVFCDIAYFHSRAKKSEPYRSMPIERSELEIQQTLESIRETFLDVDQRVDDVLMQRKQPHEAFPRNTHYCMSYNRMCEFASICRLSNGIDEKIPLKVGLKQGKKMAALGSYTTDSIGVNP